jgi:hypothetical protein
VKGYRDMTQLSAALDAMVNAAALDTKEAIA